MSSFDLELYKDEINEKFEEIIAKRKENSAEKAVNIEIEFRLKPFSGNLTLDTYLIVLKQFAKYVSPFPQWTRESPEEGVLDQVESFTQAYLVTTVGKKSTTSLKYKLNNIHIEEFNVNMGFALEIQKSNKPSDTKSELVRNRLRHSFVLSHGVNNGVLNKLLRVDFTEVTRISGIQEVKDYQIEVEVLSTTVDNPLDTFNLAVVDLSATLEILLKLINNTRNLYTKEIRLGIIQEINSNLAKGDNRAQLQPRGTDKKDHGTLFTNYMNNPVDLIVSDIQTGTPGSLFPYITSDQSSSPVEYMVTIKADGERIFIYWTEFGLVLFNPRSQLINLFSLNANENLLGTMFDGELLPLQDGHVLSKIYTILVFDCLFCRIDDVVIDLRREELVKRLVARDLMIDEYNNDEDIAESSDLIISGKSFYPFNSRETFFEANREALKTNIDPATGQLFDSDGLIYTHTGPYLSKYTKADGTVVHSKNKKWKPLHKLTIDFKIGVINDNSKRDEPKKVLQLMYVQGEGINRTYRLDTFRGNKIPGQGTFDGKKFIPKWELDGTEFIDTFRDKDGKIHKLEIGQIVEFAWNNKDRIFYPLRIRTDKTDPNDGNKGGKDTWNLIKEPIQKGILLNELRGNKVLNLVRKFTNKVKLEKLTKVRNTILQKSGKKVRPQLVDIGSGAGGDIDKWKDLQFDVIAIEPSRRNADEFEERARNAKFEDKHWQLIYGRGEDHENILKKFENLKLRKADVVTMMHVLTFFYSSEEKVENLIKTIKGVIAPQGRFICMAMDGNMINNQLGENLQLDIPKDNPAITIRRVPDETGRKIWVRMNAKLLKSGQNEYLVDFDDFIMRMERNGFELVEDNHLNAEALLSDTELWWAQMTRVIEFRYLPVAKISQTSELRLNKIQEILMRTYSNGITQSLEPDRKLKFPQSVGTFSSNTLHKFDLYTVGVLGGGSCFLHSIVYCVNIEYRSQVDDYDSRIQTILCLRNDLKAIFDFNEYARLGDGNIKELGGDMKRLHGDSTYSYNTLKNGLGDYSHWFGLEFVEYVADKINVNIHIVWWRDNTLQVYKHSGEKLFNPERHNIVVYWQGGNHFQPVGLMRPESNKLSFVFKSDDPLIQTILQ